MTVIQAAAIIRLGELWREINLLWWYGQYSWNNFRVEVLDNILKEHGV